MAASARACRIRNSRPACSGKRPPPNDAPPHIVASPFEEAIGFSRALRIGDRILVSGTAPVEPDGSSTPGDAERQAERCLAIIVSAIEALGGDAEDVVRTRIYLTDPADADAVGRAHARWFGDVRPAATMLVVSALLRPEWRVEIEAEAMLEATP